MSAKHTGERVVEKDQYARELLLAFELVVLERVWVVLASGMGWVSWVRLVRVLLGRVRRGRSGPGWVGGGLWKLAYRFLRVYVDGACVTLT